VALSVALAVFTACNRGFAIPEGLSINIEIYNGDTLLGTVNNDSLRRVRQENVRMQTVNSAGTEHDRTYVAYSLTAILSRLNVTLPEFSEVEITGIRNNAESSVRREINRLSDAYITIGLVEDGEFAEDSGSVRLIPDKNSNDHGAIIQQVVRIRVNPPAIPPKDCETCDRQNCVCDVRTLWEGCEADDCTCPVISVGVYFGEELLYTITNEDLTGMEYRIGVVRHGGAARWYMAFNIAEILENADIEIGTFTDVTPRDAAGETFRHAPFIITTLANSYLTFYRLNDTTLVPYVESGTPRFISTMGETTGSNIFQGTAKIVLTPAA
jgi:hypothetical protein